jgi:hypothetical protein
LDLTSSTTRIEGVSVSIRCAKGPIRKIKASQQNFVKKILLLCSVTAIT